ncbi:ABC transporter permease [Undibacterium sp. TS12]|uniref:ABC transporter permease n=1 Tax=Undibacterium sp. TS12 TaxID=2908202 RepID=UPI001F4C8458|nr:ABC transporter permease [Undibacterium sp. TS12]MCH8620532.1 ABC transporter permease [Undibacterium sp. TS12]
MLAYLLRRLLQSMAVLLAMATIVFLGIYAIGNPVDIMLSPDADQLERDQLVQRLGLDQPLYMQLGRFLVHAVQGDLGNSFVYGEPAMTLILQRLPATLELAVAAMVIAIFIGVPLGIMAGLKPDAWTSRTIISGSILGFSLPNFLVGMILIMFFSVYLGWFPSGGRGMTVQALGADTWSIFSVSGLRHMFLPALNLAIYNLALIIRLARASTREVASQDYIKFARAIGLSQRRIVGVHVLKNIMIPLVTIIGLEFGSLMAFAVVTERVFAWPGMGKLLLDSILHLDRPVVVAYMMFTVFLFVSINFLVDVLYAALDPRINLQGKSV